MKSVTLLLTLSISLLVLCAEDHSVIGISKSSHVVMQELAASVTKTLDMIGYLRMFDMSEKVKIFLITPVFVLKDISVSALKVVSPLKPEHLIYEASDSAAIITANASLLSLTADINLNWYCMVGGVETYQGGYKAKLKAEKVKLQFTFVNGSPVSTGDISFEWKLTDPVIIGFGAFSVMTTYITNMLNSKLFAPLNAELNRYNDMMISKMIYDGYYRGLPLPIKSNQDESVILKNDFKNFALSTKGEKHFLSFVFSSSVYFTVQHLEIPFVNTFQPADDGRSDVSVYIGASPMREVFEQLVKKSSFKEFIITPEVQHHLFGYMLSIGVLANFYPNLLNLYESTELVNIKCTMKDRYAGSNETYVFACKIMLAREPPVLLFDMPSVEWASEFFVRMAEEDSTGKTIAAGVTNFKFTNLVVKYPKMADYLQMQFETFLQPLAKFPGAETHFDQPIVGTNLNWTYMGMERNEQGDATVHYSHGNS